MLCATAGASGRRRRRRGPLFAPAAVGRKPRIVLPMFQGESFHVSTDEPMMASMAGRYAAALFELAKDEGQLPAVEADLKAFQAMLDESADLRRLVRSP